MVVARGRLMNPVVYSLIWIGLIGLVVAALSANAADAMAEEERRSGDADRNAPAFLNIVRFAGVPVGRWMNLLIVFTPWYADYKSPLIRYLAFAARVGLCLGVLFPLTTLGVFMGLDAALRP
ncbi:hypothetical protein [Brevundimonas sp. GN22]